MSAPTIPIEAYQGIYQLTRRTVTLQADASMAEARVIELLRNARPTVEINGSVKVVRAVMRNVEASKCDLYIIAMEKNVEGTPSPDATDHEVWEWARHKDEADGVKLIAADVKIMMLSGGRSDDSYKDSLSYVAGSAHVWDQDNRDTTRYEVIFAWVSGVTDAIAVMPTLSYSVAKDWAYGLEPLTGKAPLVFSSFMVQKHQLDLCLEEIIKASLVPGYSFVNPTTKVQLDQWKPQTVERPLLLPDIGDKGAIASCAAMVKLWDEIKAYGHGFTVDFNQVAPNLYDFNLVLPDGFIHGCEFKNGGTFLNLSSSRNLGRRHVFSPHRQWTILFARLGSKLFCMCRNEISSFGRSNKPSKEFLTSHIFDGFAQASEHIARNTEDAFFAKDDSLHQARPEHVCAGLNDLEVVGDDGDEERFVGRLREYREVLAGVHMELNAQAADAGWGVFLPLGEGQPTGSLTIMVHDWSIKEKSAYFQHGGELPLTTWSPGACDKTVGVVRLQEHSSPSNRTPIEMPLSFRRGDYKKPTPCGRHVLLLGTTLHPDLYKTGSARNSQFTLIPSGFTTLSTEKETRPQPHNDLKKYGVHIASPLEAMWTEITEPKWEGHANAASMSNRNLRFFKDTKVNPLHYVMGLKDGSIYRAIREVMTGSGLVRIDNPRWAGMNTLFDPRPYRKTLKDVQSENWGYGYARMCNRADLEDVVAAHLEKVLAESSGSDHGVAQQEDDQGEEGPGDWYEG